jgi:hypothetical protein
MTPTEHRAEAERLAQYCAEIPFDHEQWSALTTATAAIAQVHAVLSRTAEPSLLSAALVMMENRGGVAIRVDGEWHEIRVDLITDVLVPGERAVLSLDSLALLLRAEEVRS